MNNEYQKLGNNMNNTYQTDTKPFQPSDFKHSEYELDSIAEAEVINTNCVYFGETVWITHKAYALEQPWYKAELGYYIGDSSDTEVWFKEDEIEFI